MNLRKIGCNQRLSLDKEHDMQDFNNSCLVQYGVALDTVAKACTRLLDGSVKLISVKTSHCGRARLQQVSRSRQTMRSVEKTMYRHVHRLLHRSTRSQGIAPHIRA